MGSILTSLVMLSAAFAAGIEIARRHPEKPWAYLRSHMKKAWDEFTTGPADEPVETKPEQ